MRGGGGVFGGGGGGGAKCVRLHKCVPHHFGAATDQPKCLDPPLMTCQLGILVFYLDS